MTIKYHDETLVFLISKYNTWQNIGMLQLLVKKKKKNKNKKNKKKIPHVTS